MRARQQRSAHGPLSDFYDERTCFARRSVAMRCLFLDRPGCEIDDMDVIH